VVGIALAQAGADPDEGAVTMTRLAPHVPASRPDSPPANDDGAAMVRLDDVVRVFGRGDGEVRALDGVTVSMTRGTFTAIMGPSGSGKSTLLQLAAGLDRPTQGRVRLGEQELSGLNERALARLRRERIGFVFQSFNLLGALTAEQNVALPARLAGARLPRSAVRDVLRRVGLEERRGHRPAQLSGGQQQRVAIARALVGRPSVVFADEPTGALDTRSGRAVLALLRETIDETGGTLVMVTHDPSAAAWADRVVFMADGRLAGELRAPSAEDVAERLTGLGA
jgi:putative ABC transport system ATP-binding protein